MSACFCLRIEGFHVIRWGKKNVKKMSNRRNARLAEFKEISPRAKCHNWNARGVASSCIASIIVGISETRLVLNPCVRTRLTRFHHFFSKATRLSAKVTRQGRADWSSPDRFPRSDITYIAARKVQRLVSTCQPRYVTYAIDNSRFSICR